MRQDAMVKNRFAKGRRIVSIADLVSVLQTGLWVYWGSRPKHPSILWHMQLRTLRDAITRGILYVALEALP